MPTFEQLRSFFIIVFSDAEDNWYCKRFALIIRIIKVPLSLLLHNRNRTHISAASYSLKENLLGPFLFVQRYEDSLSFWYSYWPIICKSKHRFIELLTNSLTFPITRYVLLKTSNVFIELLLFPKGCSDLPKLAACNNPVSLLSVVTFSVCHSIADWTCKSMHSKYDKDWGRVIPIMAF